MKTLVTLFFAAFFLVSTSSFAQTQKTTFDNINLTKAGDGASCMQLNWTKGAENTAYYLVERSANGKDFNQVALVFTSEDAAFTDYKFRDKGYATAGNAVYYRITIVNDQKELTYLPVKKVDVFNANTFVAPDSADVLVAAR